MRGGWGDGPVGRASVGRHLEEVVGLVLHDVEIVSLADFVDGAAAGGTGGCACGILACRHCVKEMRLFASLDVRVPVIEKLVHFLGNETFFVHGNASDADAMRESGFHGGGESVVFGEHGVSRLDEHAESHVKGRGAANGHGASPVFVFGLMHHFCVLGDPSQELSSTGALAVVEGGSNVEDGLVLCKVMFSGCDDLSRRLRLSFREVADGGNFARELFKGKVFAGWQTAAEGDESGLSEELGCFLEVVSFADFGFVGEAICV